MHCIRRLDAIDAIIRNITKTSKGGKAPSSSSSAAVAKPYQHKTVMMNH